MADLIDDPASEYTEQFDVKAAIILKHKWAAGDINRLLIVIRDRQAANCLRRNERVSPRRDGIDRLDVHPMPPRSQRHISRRELAVVDAQAPWRIIDVRGRRAKQYFLLPLVNLQLSQEVEELAGELLAIGNVAD